MGQRTAEEEVGCLQREAVDVVIIVQAHVLLDLGAQLRRELLVCIKTDDPFGVDAAVVNAPVELAGVVFKLMEVHVGAVGLGQLYGAVGAAAVYHADAAAQVLHRFQAADDVLFFVFGQYDGGDIGHGENPFMLGVLPFRRSGKIAEAPMYFAVEFIGCAWPFPSCAF